MLDPRPGLLRVARRDRRRPVQVVGPEVRALDPAALIQQLALDDFRVSRRPDDLMHRLVLIQPVACRDPTLLALVVDSRRDGWHGGIHARPRPQLAGRSVEILVRFQMRDEVVEGQMRLIRRRDDVRLGMMPVCALQGAE